MGLFGIMGLFKKRKVQEIPVGEQPLGLNVEQRAKPLAADTVVALTLKGKYKSEEDYINNNPKRGILNYLNENGASSLGAISRELKLSDKSVKMLATELGADGYVKRFEL